MAIKKRIREDKAQKLVAEMMILAGEIAGRKGTAVRSGVMNKGCLLWNFAGTPGFDAIVL